MKITPMSTLPTYQRIAGIFPDSGITLLVGGVGTGKTYSTMKALKLNNVIPYWFNLDHTNLLPDFQDNDFKMVIDPDEIKEFIISKTIPIPTDMQVLVIDTYTQLSMLIDDPILLVKGLERIASQSVAVIVLAHPENYQSKTSIVFKDNKYLLGNCHEYLELIKYPASNGSRTYPPTPERTELTLIKGRMYQGFNPIINWMR